MESSAIDRDRVFAAGILAAIVFSVWIADCIYQNAFFGFVKPTEASIDNALIALTYWRHRMGLYALWLLCGGVVCCLRAGLRGDGGIMVERP